MRTKLNTAPHTKTTIKLGRTVATAVLLVSAWLPSISLAAWQVVATEQGKRIEIDRDSITPAPGGGMTAKGRIVLDKVIVDPRTSVSYRSIEIFNRFDCEEGASK